jgi:hypothetical protein
MASRRAFLQTLGAAALASSAAPVTCAYDTLPLGSETYLPNGLYAELRKTALREAAYRAGRAT